MLMNHNKKNRIILHCDMNSFYASVELLDYPELINKPVAVAGNPETRHGIILAKNEIAKKYGIVTAETIWMAKQKCPELITLKSHMYKYKAMSKVINEIYGRYTDLLEPFSIDESWLDVTNSINLFSKDCEIQFFIERRGYDDLLKKVRNNEDLEYSDRLLIGTAIGDHIRYTVRKELGLTLSVGVSFNKVFAKMGSDYKKPYATTLISPENYKDLIWPLSIGELFFVGKKTAQSLNKIGVYKIGDVGNLEPSFLEKTLGKAGLQIYDYACGLDDAPVSHLAEKRKIGTVGNGRTFDRNLIGEDDIKVALLGLSDQVSARLRKYQLKALGVKIDVKDPNFKVISRQMQLTSGALTSDDLYKASFELIKANWNFKDPIRLLTVTAINLVDENTDEQISFWSEDDASKEKKEAIGRTLDSVRGKYGDTSLTFGSLINNDIGISGKHHIEED